MEKPSRASRTISDVLWTSVVYKGSPKNLDTSLRAKVFGGFTVYALGLQSHLQRMRLVWVPGGSSRTF